jgi:hypothetical protein
MMSTCFAAVIVTFKGFLEADSEVLARIHAFTGELFIHEDALVFTIRGLREFLLVSGFDPVQVGDYPSFRQQLYRNPINSRLQDLGGMVEVAENLGTVNKNLYQLVRHTA